MTVNCENKTVDISEINNKTFNAGDSYTFTIPSYLASGGDGYPKLDDSVDTGDTDAKVLYDFLETKKVIFATDYVPVASDVVYLNSESEFGCQISTNP